MMFVKKIFALALALSLCLALASCGEESQTPSNVTSILTSTVSAPVISIASATPSPVPSATPAPAGDKITLLEKGASFTCLALTTEAYNAFLAETPEWYNADRSEWKTVNAPLGDRLGGTANAEIGWTGATHGLFAVTSFTAEDVESLREKTFTANIFYDNTITVYLNGHAVFSDIGDGTADTPDWVDDYTDVTLEGFGEYLIEGENILAVSLLDGWGGRELDLSITAR